MKSFLHRLKYHTFSAAFPLFMAVLLTVMYAFWEEIGLPPLFELVEMTGALFDQYGTWALLLAAFVEGIYMVNFYFPGSFVIVAAVFFSDKTLPELVFITAICWVAFMGATVVNYGIGRFGFYKIFHVLGGDRILHGTAKWLEKRDKWAVFLTAFQPNYLAITSVCYGMGRLGLPKLLLQAGVSMVVTGAVLTGSVAYFVTSLTQEHDGYITIMVGLFYLWAFLIVLNGFWTDYRTQKMHECEENEENADEHILKAA